MLKKMILATVAVSFAAVPVLAAPAPASKLSVAPANVRAAASTTGSSKAVEGTYLYVGAAVAAVALGIVVLADKNDSKSASR